MKPHLQFILPLCALLFAPATTVTVSAADPQSGATIQVQVSELPVREPELDLRISSEFVFRIKEVFRQRGYAGAVVSVTGYDRPDPGCYLLTLDLSKWRLDREGNVGGTFAASLATEKEVLPLGVFKDSALRWESGAGHFVPRKGAKPAEAEAAMHHLYDAVAGTSLVPGMTREPSVFNSE